MSVQSHRPGVVQTLINLSNPDVVLPQFAATLSEVALRSVNRIPNIEGLDTNHVEAFLILLCDNGYAEVSGTDQECRSVCVSVQGMIEDALIQMLRSGEVSSVKAVFLTPLPTTPLRKQGATEGLSGMPFGPACKYTLDKREITVRELREAGGEIVVVYSKESYQALEEERQKTIWEEESQHERVSDVPLDCEIPAELVGALYLITDKEGNQLYLPTHGVQAKDASEGQAIWKKWLSVSTDDNEGTVRAKQMLAFIEENGGGAVTF